MQEPRVPNRFVLAVRLCDVFQGDGVKRFDAHLLFIWTGIRAHAISVAGEGNVCELCFLRDLEWRWGEVREAVQAGRLLNVDTPKQRCNISFVSDIGCAGVNANA